MYCSRCGTLSDSGDQYCRMCGMYLTQRSGKKAKRKSGMMRGQGLQVSYLRTVLLVIVLAFAGQAALYVFFGDKLIYGTLHTLTKMLRLIVTWQMKLFPKSAPAGSQLLSTIDRMAAAAAGGSRLAVLLYGLLSLLISALQFFAMWRMFRKADIPGWTVLIPVYNVICLFRLVFGSGWTVLIPIGVSLAGSILTATGNPVMIIIAAIAQLVFWLVFFAHWAARFGHGIGYALGLAFLNPLFVLILGWGRDRYYLN